MIPQLQAMAIAMVIAVAMLVQPGAARPPSSLDLFTRATTPDPKLNSYSAAAALTARLRTVVPLSSSFSGTAYYLKPQRKIVFDNVPQPLAQFKELSANDLSFESAAADYTITPGTDDGLRSSFTLVPKNSQGRVRSIAVYIENATAKIRRAVWTYADGSTLEVEQSFMKSGPFFVPSEETIAARFPSYAVDGKLLLTGYRVNVPIDPAIFAPNPPSR